MFRKLFFARNLSVVFAVALCVSSLRSEPATPFVMPVKAPAFEIKNQELLRMGENAMSAKDYTGAVTYLSELRGKLSGTRGSSDYVLVSSLLAEACLELPSSSTVQVSSPEKGVVQASKLASTIMSENVPGDVTEAVRIHRQMVLGRYHQVRGDFASSAKVLEGIWGKDEDTSRVSRLGDLHNWTLLLWMQSLASLAERQSEERLAVPYWRRLLDLSTKRKELKAAATSPLSAAQQSVTARAGELLKRQPRMDVLECEFIRLRACAYLELGEYANAEKELKHESMSVYAMERQLMLLTCVASLGRRDEAESLFARCDREYGHSGSGSWRLALWAMMSMYYKAGDYDRAEPLLVRLEPMIQPVQRYSWLMLRLACLHGRLHSVMNSPGEGNRVLVAVVDEIYNGVMKYSALFPESCHSTYMELVRGLSANRSSAYYGELSSLLYLLGSAVAKVGNENSAVEIFGRLGGSDKVSDGMRYQAYIELGKISVSDIGRSISAFKACESLKGIGAKERSDALYLAARRALEAAAGRDGLSEKMGHEAETLLKHLCHGYSETVKGIRASYELADFYYGRMRYEEAAAYYERYFMTNRELTQEMPHERSRLRWGRCWRLMAERAGKLSDTHRQNLGRAESFLHLLQAPHVVLEIRLQSYLELYRIAMVLGDKERGAKHLDTLIGLSPQSESFTSEAFWVALYERMLGYYQAGDLQSALRIGEQYLGYRSKIRNDACVAWSNETYVLLGDILSGLGTWRKASEMYQKLKSAEVSPTPEQFAYAMYEAGYCLFMDGDYSAANGLLEEHFNQGKSMSKKYAYQSAMLLGDVRSRRGEYSLARGHYARAQGVYGQEDTYKSNLATCKQGEALLLSAEVQLRKQGGSQSAMGELEMASKIFVGLLEGKRVAGDASADHYFDLFLRAQYRLGECYELIVSTGSGDAVSEARAQALWCYKRICDYFIERAKSGARLRSSEYYIKSFNRRVALLKSDNRAMTYDVMDMIARLYEEYAALNIEGSLVAKRQAEELRASWKK